MLHLYGHDWPIRWGNRDQQRMVRVYSNCAEVELFLNGESVGIRKRDPQDFPAAGLRWSLKFKPGQNVMRAVAHSSGTTLTDQVNFIYQIEAWGQAHHLQLAVEQNSSEKIVATLHDEKGVRCLDSRAVVRFSLSGEGKLHDNLGTPSGSRVVQLANGRAIISLSHSGDIVAAVQSAGVIPAFLSLSPLGRKRSSAGGEIR